MGFLKRLFRSFDPLAQPCRCGRPAQVLVAPERELDPRAAEAYCPACLETLVKQKLAARESGLVVVQPYRDAPCLIPHLLEELREFGNWPIRLQELLSSAGRRCERCGADTPGMLWVCTEAQESVSAMQENLHWFDGREGQAVCVGCLTSLLLRTIAERELRLQELVFPADGPGAWLPWAY